MRIEQLLENRQLFIQCELAELKEAIQSSTKERVQLLFQMLAEKDWVAQLPLQDVTKLGVRALRIIPEDLPDAILYLFLESIVERKPPKPDKSLTELVFKENPRLYKRYLLQLEKSTLPEESKNTDSETLVCLDATLKIRRERPQEEPQIAIESYINEIRSLDSTTPENLDLLMILFYERDLHLIALALKKHINEQGVEFVQKRIDAHVNYIGTILDRTSFGTILSFFGLFHDLGLKINGLKETSRLKLV